VPGAAVPGAGVPGAGVPGAGVPGAGVPGLPAGLGNVNNVDPGAGIAGLSPEELAKRPVEKRIEQRGADGDVIAGLYRQFTGRRVIVASAARQVTIDFVQDPPLTNGEAAELLKKAALLEGLVFVPAGPGIDKLVLATGGPNPKGQGLPLYLDLSELPAGDEVVSYVMMLSYIKPDEAVRTFTQVVGQFGAYGSIAAVPNASAIVVTENTSLIRSLVLLKEQIDVPSAQVGTRFIKVEYADVEMLAETLNEILNTQQQAQKTAGVQRGQGAPAPTPPGLPNVSAGDGAGGAGAGAGEDTPVQIVPDARTNRIFVMGRPIDLVFVEGLVREFDTPTDKRNYLRRKLKFLSVSDFLPIASDALSRAFGGSDQAGGAISGGGGGTSGSSRTGSSSSRSGTSGSRTSRSGSSGSRTSALGGSSGSSGTSFGSGGYGGGGGGVATGISGMSGNLGDPNVNSAPESLLIGRTLLVADNITNSIVVQGPPQALEIIAQLLDQIDVKAEQVMLSTIFGQLTLGDDLEFGLSFLKTVNQGTDLLAGQSRNKLTDLLDPSKLLDPANPTTVPGAVPFPETNGLGLYGKVGDMYMFLHALEETGKFNVVARPTVFVANNQRGMILSGQQIAVPTNSYNYGGVNTGQSTNIEYRDVALSLEVVPLVNSADEVTLQISLVAQDLGEERVIGTGANALITNDIINRELLTTVTVPNKQTIVLGGLITTNDRNAVSGIPVLSSIPLVGKLFSTTKKEHNRQELIIFIQPHIVNSPGTLNEAQFDMNDRYDMAGEVLDLGANGNPSLLPTRNQLPAPPEEPAAAPPPRATKASKREAAVPVAQPVESTGSGKRGGSLSRPGTMFRKR
jgi:type II secretion system protein D